MDKKNFEQALMKVAPQYKKDEVMAHHCTWKIGGPADYFVEVDDDHQISGLWQLCQHHHLPLVITGGGSNLLWSDRGLRGVALKIGPKYGRIERRDNVVACQSGVYVPALARLTANWGLSGLEHLIGVPGCLGGLIHMNGGSLRKSIGDSVVVVTALDHEGQIQILPAQHCKFSYRHSIFQENGWIVLAVRLQLEPSDPFDVRRSMLAIAAERRSKFPLQFPNCGSVFSNLPELFERFGPPGAVIDRLGLKGTAVGALCVSEQHANFFVNRGGGTSEQALKLIEIVQQRIQQETGLVVPCEVRAVTETGKVVPADQAI